MIVVAALRESDVDHVLVAKIAPQNPADTVEVRESVAADLVKEEIGIGGPTAGRGKEDGNYCKYRVVLIKRIICILFKR